MKNKIQLLKTGLLSAFVLAGMSTFAQFSGSYAPSNWTFNAVTSPSDGYVDVSGAPGSIILAGDDDGSGGCCDEHVSYSVTIPTSGSVYFDYNHNNPDIDEAYYAINGTRTIISYGSGSGSIGPIAVTAGDVFSFLVVSYDDCCGRGVLTISNFTGPALLISVDAATNPTSCQPNNGSIAITVSGGASPYSYSWNSGTYTTEDVFGLAAGTYSLTVTDANGSSATSSTTLTEVAPPSITVDATTNVDCNGSSTGGIAITGSGGTTPYTYSWNSGAYTTEDLSNIPVGSYNLTMTDADGCTASASATVSEPAVLSATVDNTTNVNCNGNSTGAINITTSGGTAPYSYIWNSGAYTTENLSNIPAGVYSLSLTDANGCSASASATISEPAVLSTTVDNTTDADCNGNSTGAINVTTSGGTVPYSYSWNSGAYATEDLSNIPAGVYNLSVTDANGCSVSTSTTINEPSSLAAGITTVTNVDCYGNNTGAIGISVSGGTTPYSYNWNSGAYTTQDLSGLSAGSYNLTVTDYNGCSTSTLATVNEPLVLSAAVNNTTDVDCNGNSTGAINITTSGGTTPYSYNWNSGAYTTEDLTNIPTGSYSLSVTDANGCLASASATINEPSTISATVDNTTDVDCNGNATGAINVTTSGGTSPYSYDWNSGSYTTEDLINILAGTYGLSITDANGCSASVSATINEPSAISATVDNTTDVDCNGNATGAINVTVAGGTAPYSYNWNSGAYSTKDLANIPAGSYSLSITDANGCSSSMVANVNEPTSVAVSINSTTDIDCNGNSTGMIDATVAGGTAPYSYNWNAGSYATEDLSNIPAGTFDLTATDANGCSATATATISEPAILAITIDSVTDVDCNGMSNGAINSSVSGGTAPYSYNWNAGAYITEDISGVPAGTYNFVVTDVNGCSTSLSATVNEPTVLAITIDNVSDVDCNGNNSGSINISVGGGTAPYIYNWNNGTYSTANLSGLAPGTYDLIITDTNGCSSTTSVDITEPLILSATIDTTVNPSACGSTDGSIFITTTGGTSMYAYDWNVGTYFTEDLSGIGSGFYQLTISDANGCTFELTDSLVEPMTLVVSIDSITNVDCNGNSTGAVYLSSTGGAIPYTYNWNNGVYSTEDITGITAGAYSLVVTDANNCSTGANAIVAEPDTLSIIIDSTMNVLCNGASTGAISVSVSGGTMSYSYDWNSGAFITEDLTGLSAGNYILTVTDAHNCTSVASVTLIEPSALSLSAISTDEINGNDGAIDLTVTGGTPSYSFSWDNGMTTEDLSGLTAGTYSVTVSDANGCTDSTSATVTSHVSVEEYGEIVLNVYPNPTSGIVYIEFSDILNGNIKVYNSIGQILSSRNITNIRHEINLGEYEQGVYFIEVSGNGFKKTISIVHQ